ncbi:Fic family protein [Noviherbaspirillum cavernae]|uniref:Fic family protein n=1 Tax=Noviherbaspirillum cavernae TaxID=2320862 RepID=A0A418X3I3_9BURK|nr:Fic family protein [Noviherbaspirillum cavernae]
MPAVIANNAFNASPHEPTTSSTHRPGAGSGMRQQLFEAWPQSSSVSSSQGAGRTELDIRQHSKLLDSTFRTIDAHMKQHPWKSTSHRQNAAFLVSLNEVCKQRNLGINPAIDAHVDFARLLKDAANACSDYTSKLAVPCANETFTILYDELNDNPHLQHIAPLNRARLSIDPCRIDAVEKSLQGSGIETKGNPLLAFLFDDETRYQYNMKSAWKMAMEDVHEPVDCDWLIRLHDLAIGKASDGPLEFRSTDDPPAAGFGLDKSVGNLSDKGEQEVREYLEEGKQFHQKANADIAHGWGLDGTSAFFSYTTKPADLRTVADGRLKKYHDRIALIGSSDDTLSVDKRIYAAIDLCQKLERLHPFMDGNCRTFGILLLNRLLVQQGQNLTMLDNPNKLDGYARGEIFDLVKQGQQWIKNGFPDERPAIASNDDLIRELEDSLRPASRSAPSFEESYTFSW